MAAHVAATRGEIGAVEREIARLEEQRKTFVDPPRWKIGAETRAGLDAKIVKAHQQLDALRANRAAAEAAMTELGRAPRPLKALTLADGIAPR